MGEVAYSGYDGGGGVAAIHAKNLGRLPNVIVVDQRHGYGRIDRTVTTDKCQQPAVVAASEPNDVRPAAESSRRPERHHVRLGAAVGEANALQRRKASAKQRRKLAFPLSNRCKIESSIDGGMQGGADARLGMAE